MHTVRKLGVLVLLAITTACGSGGHGNGSATNLPNPPQDNYAGAWEFVLSPVNTTATTYNFDAIITQSGTALSSATVYGVLLSTNVPTILGSGTLAGTYTGKNVQFVITLGGLAYQITAAVSGSGTLVGTYAVSGSSPGTVVAAGISALSGSYNGVLQSSTLNLSTTFTLKEASNYGLTVTGIPSVDMTGTVTARVAQITGTLNGQQETFTIYSYLNQGTTLLAVFKGGTLIGYLG
jgi:hypothetical protein